MSTDTAAILAPRLWHDPGVLRTVAAGAAPFGAATVTIAAVTLLPLALALGAILTVSAFSRLLWQAKHRIGAPRRPSRQPPPPRRHSYSSPSGRPPGEPPSDSASSSRSPLGQLRASSQQDHVRLLRAAFAAATVAELAPISATHRALLALITAFFVLGAIVVGSTAPPPSSLRSAIALAALPARLRPPRFPFRLLLRGPRCACLAAGGLARRLRAFTFSLARLPLLVIPLLFAFAYSEPAAANTVAESTYRARCDYDCPPAVVHAPWCTAPELSSRNRRRSTNHHRALLGHHSSMNLSKTTLKALLNRGSSGQQTKGRLRLIIDSGCTINCHPRQSDLINQRPSRETMSGIDGIKRQVQCVGDLPIFARDQDGKERKLLVRGVRCVPQFTETLISVDRLWEDAKAEARFANKKHIRTYSPKGDRVYFPFERASDGLYTWNVTSALHHHGDRDASKAASNNIALVCQREGFDVADFHRPKTHSHLDAMNPGLAAAHLHHRLHLSPGLITKLPSLAADVPSKIARADGAPCVHCVEANATRLSHKSNDVYKPSYVGRLVHADIVGPFKTSIVGSYKYVLVLVDDHSRTKYACFLRNKGEALKHIRSFVAALNAQLNKGRSAPTQVVGSLHTDNAGEFLSREFKDFLAEEVISQTTCPPYVHSLNGVAERAIRSIMENARAHLIASNAPISFWPYAVEHAVDILNRSTGPPGSDQSSFELVHGQKPKLLPIQPFGCRSVVVRPRHSYSKTQIDAHGEVGINLGKSPSVTSGYRIWIPSRGKIVSSSDVYFDATFMPWRPDGDRRVGPVVPTTPPPDDSPLAPSPTAREPVDRPRRRLTSRPPSIRPRGAPTPQLASHGASWFSSRDRTAALTALHLISTRWVTRPPSSTTTKRPAEAKHTTSSTTLSTNSSRMK